MILGAECEWVRSLINNPCFRYNVTQLTSATERLSAPRLFLVRVLYICAASFRLDFEGASPRRPRGGVVSYGWIGARAEPPGHGGGREAGAPGESTGGMSRCPPTWNGHSWAARVSSPRQAS